MAIGDSRRQRHDNAAALARKTISAMTVPIEAARKSSSPVTSSRCAVRGLSASYPRSRIRFAAMATVRADTMAIVISTSSHQWTERVSCHMAVNAEMYANGRAKTECSIITSRRNFATRPRFARGLCGNVARSGPVTQPPRSPSASVGPAPNAVRGPAAVDQLPGQRVDHTFLRPSPIAAIPLARQLAGGIHPELAAEELFVGGVVQVIDRTHGVQRVVGVIDVPECSPRDLRVVVHVTVPIDDDDQLRQRHQSGAPYRIHHLLGMFGEPLLDRDDDAIVKHARLGQVVVDDLRNGEADQGQENSLGGLPDRPNLLRWSADNDRQKDRV